MRRKVASRRRVGRSAVAAITILLAVAACGMTPTRAWGKAGAAVQPTATPTAAPFEYHDFHVNQLGLDCTQCHTAPKGAKGSATLVLSVRPGHAACQDCHDEVASAKKETKVCRVCHIGNGAALAPFPSGILNLTEFSHAGHVDPKGRLNVQGVRQDCITCHQPTAHGQAGPNHPQCVLCHASKGVAKPTLDLSGPSTACATCHSLKRIDAHLAARMRIVGPPTVAAHAGGVILRQVTFQWATASGEPYRDIVPFPHRRHLRRRDGAAIGCMTCHSPVVHQTQLGTVTVPKMKVCASCHDNATYVRAPYLIKRCEICHRKVRADLRPLPTDPVSPRLVHNDAFRRFHYLQASDANAPCGYCHPEAINVKVDRCAGCHSSMQPRSHLQARWSDLWHGRQAGLDRKECAACHAADFCVKCHSSVLPRSHVPLNAFVAGRHAEAASLDLRGCFTCHSFEQTCAECHNQQLGPPTNFGPTWRRHS